MKSESVTAGLAGWSDCDLAMSWLPLLHSNATVCKKQRPSVFCRKKEKKRHIIMHFSEVTTQKRLVLTKYMLGLESECLLVDTHGKLEEMKIYECY